MATIKKLDKLLQFENKNIATIVRCYHKSSSGKEFLYNLAKHSLTSQSASRFQNLGASSHQVVTNVRHAHLPPLPEDPTPVMPLKSSYTLESCTTRRKWVEQFSGANLHSTAQWWPKGTDHTTDQLEGNIERPIGQVSIPLAVAGPLKFNGANANGWFLAPMATTEGALIASVCRGAKAISMSGGVRTWATQQRMTRAPVFFCADPIEANLLGEWVIANRTRIQEEVVSKFSRRASLKDIIAAYDMDACHTLLRYETGDAAGQNMTTVCSWETAKWINEVAAKELGVSIRHFCVEGNMSADKKCSSLNALLGRGVSVTAQADIPENVMQMILGLSSETICDVTRYSHRISERIGQHAGFNINVANVLGGMFTALGQDIACVHESAISRVDFIKLEGGLRVTMYLPCLVVGTVGGGTKLPTQKESLEIIDCYGVGKVRKLAEIIAGYCLALDLSTYSAVVGGHFADAHDRLGRNRPDEK